MRRLTLVWVAVCMIAAFGRCVASGSTVTVEEAALRHVASATHAFADERGRPPKTWEEIALYVDLEGENSAMTSAYGFRLQDRYQFVTKPFPMFRNGGAAFDIDEDSQVLLVRVIPFKDYRDGKNWRTFVYQSKKVGIAPGSLLEEKAQRLFKTYHVAVAVPAGLPTQETNLNRSTSGVSGLLPDPEDARRVLGFPPGTPRSPSEGEAGAPVGVAGNSAKSAPLPGGWALWGGIAAVLAAAAGWLWLRSKGQKK